jgi:hypothetical protein
MAPLHQVIQTIFLLLITFNALGVGVPFIIPPSPTRPVAGSNERERSSTIYSSDGRKASPVGLPSPMITGVIVPVFGSIVPTKLATVESDGASV